MLISYNTNIWWYKRPSKETPAAKKNYSWSKRSDPQRCQCTLVCAMALTPWPWVVGSMYLGDILHVIALQGPAGEFSATRSASCSHRITLCSAVLGNFRGRYFPCWSPGWFWFMNMLHHSSRLRSLQFIIEALLGPKRRKEPWIFTPLRQQKRIWDAQVLY